MGIIRVNTGRQWAAGEEKSTWSSTIHRKRILLQESASCLCGRRSFSLLALSAFPSYLRGTMDSEDKSLDDFFAKKDKGKKGKSKTKGKFTTSSSLTKQVEKSQKPLNEQTKEQKPTASLSSSQVRQEGV